MLAYTPTPEEQIREFDEKGYLIVHNALDSTTLSKLEQASDRLIDSDIETNRQANPTGLYDGFRNTVTLQDRYANRSLYQSLFDADRYWPLAERGK